MATCAGPALQAQRRVGNHGRPLSYASHAVATDETLCMQSPPPHLASSGSDAVLDNAATARADGTVTLFRGLPNTPPAGWEVVMTGEAYQMVLSSPPNPGAQLSAIDDESGAAVELRSLHDSDVAQMCDLVRLTEPGPFNARTIELGGYVGVFHADELVAMAGQRLRPPGYCEVSAVCTHPTARRRRYASTLTAAVATAIYERGEVPFLHVAVTNTAAYAAYQQMGFEVRTQVGFGVYRVPAGRNATETGAGPSAPTTAS